MLKIFQNLARKDPRTHKWAINTIHWLRNDIDFSNPSDVKLLELLGQQFVVFKKKNESPKEYANEVADKMKEVIIGKDGIIRATDRLRCTTGKAKKE